MITAISFARNDPCPCGSGKKYKKCCQPAVEDLARKLGGQSRPWVSPQMAMALGLMGALRPQYGEQPVAEEELVAALDSLEEELISTDPDEDAWAEMAARYTTTFVRLLEEDEALADLRFEPEEVEDFLAWAETQPALADADPDDDEFMELFLEHIEKYLYRVLDAAKCEELAWAVIRAMRGAKRDLEENTALLFSLWLCLDELAPNPVWEEIFLFSLGEMGLMDEDEDEDEDDDEEEDDAEGEDAERFADPAWPIVRTYIPWQDAWQATGCGSAWVVQQQPDGRYALSAFNFQLLFGGLDGVYRRLDMTMPEVESFMADCWKQGLLAPWQEGPLSLVSTYVWGCYLLSLREDVYWKPGTLRCLEVVPQPEGSAADWISALVGPHGLTSPELYRVVQKNKPSQDLPPNKEPVVLTTVTFSLTDPRGAISILKKRAPEFSFQGEDKTGQSRFSWTREYPPGHDSPLAGTGARQLLGEVHVGRDTLTVTTQTLSWAARLMWKLNLLLGERLHYRSAQWTSPQDILSAGAAPAAEVPVYQLKVTLKGSKPPIWRRFQVEGDITLYRLHQVLQAVMGWQDYHLYQFTIQGAEYGEPDPEFEHVKSAKRYKLVQVLPAEKMKFRYEYDFGDGWEHEIIVEKILSPAEGVRYPVCLAGKRACPPEDCGGIWGYQNLLEIIADPQHEEHEEMMQWLGGAFDPEEFDPALVNEQLKPLQRKRRPARDRQGQAT